WPRCRISKTPLVNTSGRARAWLRTAASQSLRDSILDSNRAGMGDVLGGRHTFEEVLAVAVQVLHGIESAVHQQRHVVQYAGTDLAFPFLVEMDLVVQPVFQPARRRQFGLHRVLRVEVFVDM